MDVKRQPLFLTAKWTDLLLANYSVDPEVLKPYVPKGTELDLWEGLCFVSLVAFRFNDTNVKGFSVPFHRDFPEVNLRFYVRYRSGEEWKRGVCFIRELVPRPAIAWLARTLFNEAYISVPMRRHLDSKEGVREVRYDWKFGGEWNHISAKGPDVPHKLEEGSLEYFITQHFWGYAKGRNPLVTIEYEVDHPAWNWFEIESHEIQMPSDKLYPAPFMEVMRQKPHSLIWAEGSEVSVYSGKKILKAGI